MPVVRRHLGSSPGVSYPCFHPFQQGIWRQGTAEIITLDLLTAFLTQEMQLLFVFDALGEGAEVETPSKADDGVHNGFVFRVRGDIADERLVNF